MKRRLKSLVDRIKDVSGEFEELDLLFSRESRTDLSILKDLVEKTDFPNDFEQALEIYGDNHYHSEYPEYLLSIPHFGGMGLLNHDQIVKSKKLLDKEFIPVQDNEHDIDGLEKVTWNKLWIPIASDNSGYFDEEIQDYDVLILDPESKLKFHVIHWSNGPVRLLNSSFSEYLDEFYEALDDDDLEYDETYGFSY